MPHQPPAISLREFASLLRSYKGNRDKRFCFLIGAGASVSSGIRAAGDLAREWLADLKNERLDGDGFERWKQAAGIDENRPDEFYTTIYARRFHLDPTEGSLFLEREMEGRRPKIGYALLALILRQTGHNFVITTNFDSLLEDALFTLRGKRPLVCGHENMASFIESYASRPTLIKVHRDLLLDPFNTPEQTAKLKEQWVEALSTILSSFPLIVTGYGGNDGSLMDWLDGVKRRKPIYWCTRNGKPVSDRIAKVLRPGDQIVSIESFDKLMITLARALDIDMAGKLYGETSAEGPLISYARDLEESYRKSLVEQAEPTAAGSPPNQVTRDLIELVQGKDAKPQHRSWVEVELAAKAEANPELRDAIYRQGVDRFPESADLLGNYAVFLTDVRKDHDAAERLFKRALELDPAHANNTGNYASFLTDVRKDHDAAERLYKRALELEPAHANNTGNYASFLKNVTKDHDAAERLFKRALELNPAHANNTGNYASFLTDVRKDHDAAERLYKRALELDPNSANKTGNYASLLFTVGKMEVGRQYLEKALEGVDNPPDLQSELQFYRLAHCPDQRDDARVRLQQLLDKGYQSPGWNFSGNIAQAARDGYPDVAELCRFAEQISGVPHAVPEGQTPKPPRKPRKGKG